MAAKKSESRCKQPEGVSPAPLRYTVTNTANQPREFKLSGTWYRWEPRGQQGDTVSLAESIINRPDFKSVAQYFVVKKGA